MKAVDFIDLSQQDEENETVLNESKQEKSDVKSSPAQLALKDIGLSLIKFRYGEHEQASKVQPFTIHRSWDKFWNNNRYPLGCIFDEKYVKSFRCLHYRDSYCQNKLKMSRINFIHHCRRGHIRKNPNWKRNIQNRIESSIIQIRCVICQKKSDEWFSPETFGSHMKKMHPNFLPIENQLDYFNKCIICGTDTDSVINNVIHREDCSKALYQNSNDPRTVTFNECFKELLEKSITFQNLKTTNVGDFERKLENSLSKWSVYAFCINYKKYLKGNNIPPSNGHFTGISNKVYDDNNVSNTINNDTTNTNLNHNYFTKGVINVPQTSKRNISANIVNSTTQSGYPNVQTIKSKFTALQLANKNLQLKIGPRVKPGETRVADLNKFILPLHKSNDLTGTKHKNIPINNVVYCELCNVMTKGNINLYNHIRITHPHATFVDNQCKECNKKFYTPEGYQNHFNNMSKACPVGRKCYFCQACVSVNQIYHHMFNNHKKDFGRVINMNVCIICKKSNSPNVRLIHHLAVYHKMPRLLFHSKSLREEQEIIQNLVLLDKNVSEFFRCPACSFSFLTEAECRNHMILVGHKYHCEFKCGFVTVNCNELRLHTQSSHPQSLVREAVCELCHKTFANSVDKILHFLAEHDLQCFVPLN